MVRQLEIVLPSFKRGVHLITHLIEKELGDEEYTGTLNIFLEHTSAGLCLNENADPSVRRDLNSFFDRLVPENSSYFTHTLEGSDDMPAHIKSVLTGSSVTVPLTRGRINVGTWQGVYLCEFRDYGGPRRIILTINY